jgi:hypothetical protein
MAMNSSGPISLGGATTGQSINLEIGSPATSTVSLNDTIVRTLAGVATGQIVVPTDFYGKSLSSGYFQIITSPATPLWNQQMLNDPSTNTFYFKSNPSGVTPTSFMIGRSDTSGNILFATRYNPSNFTWSLNSLAVSNNNPSYLVTSFTSQAGPSAVPFGANGPGSAVIYLDKTNGSIVSTGQKLDGAPSGGTATVIDFPSGNRVYTRSSPPGFSSNVFFNSAGNYIAYASLLNDQPGPAGNRG